MYLCRETVHLKLATKVNFMVNQNLLKSHQPANQHVLADADIHGWYILQINTLFGNLLLRNACFCVYGHTSASFIHEAT